MESEKLPEDGEHRNPEKTEEGRRCKRWYECVFCKRGFTNAQALGGHMNIHRKHRSSSAKSSSSSSSKQLLNPKPNPNPSVTRFITGPFPFETSSTDSWEALRNKLSYPIHGNDHTYPILVSSSSHFGGKLGSDLTLQIGSSCPKGNEEDVALNSDDEEEGERDQDIDLELRLGRAHP